MKPHILAILVTSGIIAGCAGPETHVGASDIDGNILTGGPITGTTLNDLPKPVRDTLKQRIPRAEIADIDKMTREGQLIYKFTFTESEKYPRLLITQDGELWEEARSRVDPQK